MKIYTKKTLPKKQSERDSSMTVFVYYTNNKRFTLARFDYKTNSWYDNDGNILNHVDFLWCYLPIKKFKEFIMNGYGDR